MEEIVNSLSKWMKNGKSYPIQVQIHLTNYCNLKCIFCPTRALVKELDRRKELTKEEWFRIIDEGNKLGIREWHICGGGDPLFFTDDCLTIMQHIKKSNRYGEVITNGTFFQDEVAKKIVEMGWDKVYISLDSPDEKIQNFLRSTDCFNRIIEGTNNLVKWKKKLKKEKPEICFHSVICNKNYKQVPEMIKLAHKLGVQEVLLNALNIWKPEIKALKLSESQEKELIKILNESLVLAKKLGVENNMAEFGGLELFRKANIMNDVLKSGMKENQFEHEILKAPCFYPWYNISIFADGIAQPCFIPQGKGEQIRGKGLKEIWFGKCFEEIRKELKQGNLSEYCARCNPWNLSKMEEIRKSLQSIPKS